MFSELLLDEPLQQALLELSLLEMTDVQETAIPLALEGRDIIVNARTGSGKTVAFSLPLLQQVLDNPRPASKRSQALVLAPTRELCRQINKQITMLARHTEITTAVIIGGEDPRYQKQALLNKPDIIIATPGRLLQHSDREVIDLDDITILIVDEADRMLDLGFSEDVITVSKSCNHECQTSMYSASFNEKRFQELIDAIMFEPVQVIMDDKREANPDILQQKLPVDNVDHKYRVCAHLATSGAFNNAVIFANKRLTAEHISAKLQAMNVAAYVLHGELDQDARNRVLAQMRSGKFRLLVATDIASRGLDIPGLDMVINFDIPKNADDYIHRIGRTGRMEQAGRAINLVNLADWNRMISIENYLGQDCELLSIEACPGQFKGPEQQKSSGKAWGKKRRKPGQGSKAKKKGKRKIRDRDKKNLGKRRQPRSSTSQS